MSVNKNLKCRICGNTHNNKEYFVKEMMLGLRDVHPYFQCSKCNCLQITQIPKNLTSYYPKNYYSYDKPETKTGFKHSLMRLRDRYAATKKGIMGRLMYSFFPEEKLNTLSATHINQDSRILDVGCGAGHLLHALQDINFKHILGIDPFNEHEIEYENGLKIEVKSIFEVEGKWDLIMFHHSFEHIDEQQKVLAQVTKLLNPKGICLIRVPTVSSYAWHHYGIDWVQLDAPRHLYLHSTNSMQYLAEATDLKLQKIIYDSNMLQFWGSKQYQQDIPLRDKRSFAENEEKSLFSKQDIRHFKQQAKELNALNQGDQAAFYLQKM